MDAPLIWPCLSAHTAFVRRAKFIPALMQLPRNWWFWHFKKWLVCLKTCTEDSSITYGALFKPVGRHEVNPDETWEAPGKGHPTFPLSAPQKRSPLQQSQKCDIYCESVNAVLRRYVHTAAGSCPGSSRFCSSPLPVDTTGEWCHGGRARLP